MNPFLAKDILDLIEKYYQNIHENKMSDIFRYINEELFNEITDPYLYSSTPPYDNDNAYIGYMVSGERFTQEENARNKMYEVCWSDYDQMHVYVILHEKINDKLCWYYYAITIDGSDYLRDNLNIDDQITELKEEFGFNDTKLNHIKEVCERFKERFRYDYQY